MTIRCLVWMVLLEKTGIGSARQVVKRPIVCRSFLWKSVGVNVDGRLISLGRRTHRLWRLINARMSQRRVCRPCPLDQSVVSRAIVRFGDDRFDALRAGFVGSSV